MIQRDPDRVRGAVRETYGRIAAGQSRGCAPEEDSKDCSPDAASTDCCAPEAASTSCCEPTSASTSCCGTASVERTTSNRLGYSAEELRSAPEGSNLGLGCGNPQAIAALAPGETVLDLGSGGGFDCFLAARQVGPTGRVIGVDMTPEMVGKARANASEADASNVEFRLGEIEHLPVADGSVDVIISNCVINLSPDKPSVYREAFRALRPGGRLAIADLVTTAPIPEEARDELGQWAGCMSGADSIDEIGAMLEAAGFEEILIDPVDPSRERIREWVPGRKVIDYVHSASIEARKPPE